MPRITANGLDIHYERTGEGPRLLFISGTGGDLRVRPNMLDGPFARRFDLVAYDQAYRARYPVDGDDAEWMAARLETVCDAIDRIARDSAEGLAPPGGVPVDLDQVGDESA